MRRDPGRRGSRGVLDVDEFDELPAVLFVPAQAPCPGVTELAVELRETSSGQLAMLAYSSLGALVQACGTGQSWVRLRAAEVPTLQGFLGFQVVVMNLALPEQLRHPELDAADVPDLEPITPDTVTPDVVYVATRPYRPGRSTVSVELHRAPSGRPALLAYRSPERLHEGCGMHQPWVAIRTERLPGLALESGAATVLFDAVLGASTRHPGPSRPDYGFEGGTR